MSRVQLAINVDNLDEQLHFIHVYFRQNPQKFVRDMPIMRLKIRL